MLHFLNEGNSELNNRRFPLAKGIRKHLIQTRDSYTGDKTVDGWKRLNNILEMDGIAYSEMKRIKNFFDNYEGTKDNVEYILNGGEPMMNWVNNTLNTATTAIHDFKAAKKAAGIENAFIRKHTKNRQTKTKKNPTLGKMQTRNLNNKLGSGEEIRYESREPRTIVITENQKMWLAESMGISQLPTAEARGLADGMSLGAMVG